MNAIFSAAREIPLIWHELRPLLEFKDDSESAIRLQRLLASSAPHEVG